MDTYQKRGGKLNINNFIQIEKEIHEQIRNWINSNAKTKKIKIVENKDFDPLKNENKNYLIRMINNEFRNINLSFVK